MRYIRFKVEVDKDAGSLIEVNLHAYLVNLPKAIVNFMQLEVELAYGDSKLDLE